MKFCTDIHDPYKMNPPDFCDPLTFHVVPLAGQCFQSSSEYFHIRLVAVKHGTYAAYPSDFDD